MFALARLLLIGGVFLTIVYACLWLYYRSQRRTRLGEAWEQNPQGSKDSYVDDALADYMSRLQIWLAVIVYGLPVCLVALIVYLTNYA